MKGTRGLRITAAILLLILMGLLSLLLYAGYQSAALRKQLFLDEVELRLNAISDLMESSYYCLDLESQLDLPKLDSFYLPNPYGTSDSSRMAFRFKGYGDAAKSYTHIPIYTAARLDVAFHIDFYDIPPEVPGDSLTPFESYVRQTYARYLLNEDGMRLLDTVLLDSLVSQALEEVSDEASWTYSVSREMDSTVLYASGVIPETMPTVRTRFYSNHDYLPELELKVWVVNMDSLFNADKQTAYLGGGLLVFLAISLLIYLYRLYLQQRRTYTLQQDFIHSMTHEFNTPLSSIALATDQLSKLELNGVEPIMEVLKSETDRLKEGINLVLTTALVERDELYLNKTECRLVDLFETLNQKFQTKFSDKHMELTFHLEPNTATVFADHYHFQQVIENLLFNALKHSQASQVEVIGESKEGLTRIRVQDNGCGIGEELQQGIFQKFSRNQQNQQGYGLGLYYVKICVEAHGGTVALTRSLEGGCVFEIELTA